MDPPPTVLPLRLWDLDREVLGDWFPVHKTHVSRQSNRQYEN